MKSIYKYVLDTAWNVVGSPKIPYTMELPKGAIILSCGLQNKENICVWAKVDPNQTEMVEVEFYIFGTGWPIPDEVDNGLQFIGTVMISDGLYVYHVFIKEPVASYSIPVTSYSPLSTCEEKQLELDFQETI
jgi:hypothetical protein